MSHPKKIWSGASIRELARARMRQHDASEAGNGPPLRPEFGAPEAQESERVERELLENPSEDAHRFQWGNFQETVGNRVYVVIPGGEDEGNDGSEMRQLCATLGLETFETSVTKKKKRPHPATFLGPGFIEEVRDRMRGMGCTALIVDAPLTPAQVKNIEALIEAPVVDREGVILAIFERHARSGLSKVQVELAQLKYLQPRLAGLWAGLSRQRGSRGGLGGRGLGETRLELDRRVVKDRIALLTKRLKVAEKSLAVQAAGRDRLPRVALVGYTNAGKSTLMQALTGAPVEASPRLFSTLDTTVRALVPPTEPRILVSDTVGFVKNLPHGLVATFKSTLREAIESRLVLHVLDASHPDWFIHFETTESVLSELGVEGKNRILILNKIDRVDSGLRLRLSEILREARRHKDYLGHLTVSALTGEGRDHLREELISHCGASLPSWSRS